eukprot:scaffold164873_cov19-Tisochrysis_lutea.AAC.1
MQTHTLAGSKSSFCQPRSPFLAYYYRTVRKGLIIFTRRVLFFEVFGGFKLVHFMQAVTLFSFI